MFLVFNIHRLQKFVTHIPEIAYLLNGKAAGELTAHSPLLWLIIAIGLAYLIIAIARLDVSQAVRGGVIREED